VHDVIEQAAHRVASSEEFMNDCTVPLSPITFVDSTESTLTLRVMLHSVPSHRDAGSHALREAAVVDLSRAGLWPAPAAEPPAAPAPA
jgi:hypothetical protein